MPATKVIKNRIASVKNTRQITKAMELVAASKLRRAQEAAQRSALYAETAGEILAHLRDSGETREIELYRERKVKSRLYVVITSDRGLAGAYNGNIFKKLTASMQEDVKAGIGVKLITIGRKGSHFVARLKGVESIGAYEDFPDEPDAETLNVIIASASKAFIEGVVDAVTVIRTKYISSISQVAGEFQLLPAGLMQVEIPKGMSHTSFEPSAEAVLETVTLRMLESQLLQSILDAKASEYSMRMLAMHSATDNASGLIDDLTLEMNKARQAHITQELAEITGGAEAMK